MQPRTVALGPLATASATNIRTASAGTAGALTLNGSLVSGGVATLDVPRRILITNAADETGKTIVLTGTNWQGNTISETVTLGGIGSSASVLDYKTLTSAVLSNNSVGNLSIGTNGVAGSPWVRLDEWALPYVGIAVDVTGTVNYTVQYSLDDPNGAVPVAVANMVWMSSSTAALVAATADQRATENVVATYARVLLNSGTGSLSATFLQAGNVIQ